jgi:uncharacterized protein (UPF0332 family)
MALADDLLAQARVLVKLDATRPKQASLRRAVSTAYNALFHLLSAACIQKIAPAEPKGLGARIGRALNHTEMKDVCNPIFRNAMGPILQEFVPSGFSVEIRYVAKAFVNLQEARHFADYDTTVVHNRLDTIEFLNQAERALADWRTIRASDEAAVFLSALLFAKRWGR